MYFLKVKYLLLILLILNLKADIPLLGHLKSLSLEDAYPSLNAFGFITRSYFNFVCKSLYFVTYTWNRK